MKQNKYDITDAGSRKMIYSGLTRKEVHETIGIGLNHVYLYAKKHTCVQGKYFITIQSQESQEDDIWEQWRRVTATLKRYKGLDRIRITTKGEDNKT